MTVLIGIDCACQPENIGLARAEWWHGRANVTDVLCGKGLHSVADLVAGWINGADQCLVALDAPLGWPEAMGRERNKHRAGDFIGTAPGATGSSLDIRHSPELMIDYPFEMSNVDSAEKPLGGAVGTEPDPPKFTENTLFSEMEGRPPCRPKGFSAESNVDDPADTQQRYHLR